MDGHPACRTWRHLRMAIVALEIVLHQAETHLKGNYSSWLVDWVSEVKRGIGRSPGPDVPPTWMEEAMVYIKQVERACISLVMLYNDTNEHENHQHLSFRAPSRVP